MATRLALDSVALALTAFYLVVFAARNVSLQWDFKVYRTAASAALAGLNPYALENLSAVAGREFPFPFLYPPVALFPFLALAPFTPASAAAVWIGFNVALLAGLIVSWRRWFAPEAGLLPIALVAVFGWNAAALADLRTGNVALIESALLWSGFGCFVAGRRAAFAALIVAASCFKLAPAVFLLLLLAPAGERGSEPRRLVLSLVALGALVWGPFAIGPAAHWVGFLQNVPATAALGDANPSALGLISALVSRLGSNAGWARTATVAWALYVVALVAVSVPFLKRAWRERDPRRWVMAAVFLQVLTAPRPMAYGYVLLAPAALFWAPPPFEGRVGRLVLALVLCAQGFTRLANHLPDSLVVNHAPFLLALSIWLLIVSPTAKVGAPAASLAPI